MISFDAECISRLAYAMLQSCLHGTITGFMLYHPVFRGPSVYLAYAYLFFVVGSFRWGKRVYIELQYIRHQAQDFSQMYTASFSVLQVYMWYIGYGLYKTRKHQEKVHVGGRGGLRELFLHFALCSLALFNLVRKMTK
jgi:hypothetical protein